MNDEAYRWLSPRLSGYFFFTYLKPILPRTRPGIFLNEPDLSGPIGCTSQKTELGRFSPYVLVDNITYVYVDLKLYSTFTFKSISFARIDLFTDLNQLLAGPVA